MKKRQSFLIHLNHNAAGVVVKVYSRYIFLLVVLVLIALGGNLIFFNKGYFSELAFKVENMEERNRSMEEVVDSISEKHEQVTTILEELAKRKPHLDSISGFTLDSSESISSISDSFSLSFLSSYSDSLYTFLKGFVEKSGSPNSALQNFPLISPISSNSTYFISSYFGEALDPHTGEHKKIHEGMDFATEVGVAVVVTAPGKVIYAKTSRFWGNMVKIKHKNSISTTYAHLGKISVKKGDHVSRGKKLGEIGLSGWSVGPHVHYELKIEGKPVDPLKYLEPKL